MRTRHRSPGAGPWVGTGDVKSDILWQNSGGEVGIWEMNRTSIASAVAPVNPGAAWQLQGASEVNGDGKDDLLFMNAITDQAQTWLMNGTQVASMQAPVSVPAAAQPSAPVLSEMEIYFPAATVADMAAGSSPIGTLPLLDGSATGPIHARS
jgi:hypothetical protein